MIYKKLDQPNLLLPKGFSACGTHVGIRKNPNKLDFCLLKSDVVSNAVAVFTTNKFCAGPVIVSRDHIYPSKKLQAIVVNSGNANAGTGEQGIKDSQEITKLIGDKLQMDSSLVAPMSTGVIGNNLPMDKIRNSIDSLNPSSKISNGIDFAEAIKTTDTTSKKSGYKMIIDEKEVHLCGIAKGSGMIHPNMATMLGFITSDVNIDVDCLDELLKESVKYSFNAISVDGDTSTNDSVYVLANGKAQNKELNKNHPAWGDFCDVFQQLCQSLAIQIAKDGEGASKLIVVNVLNAITKEDAVQVGRSVISSNLLKTAMYGNDMNWGRIACAIGYSGVDIDISKTEIYAGDNNEIELMKHGQGLQFDETTAYAYLEQNEIHFTINLNLGNQDAKAWGCDLTNEYVFINGAKRT